MWTIDMGDGKLKEIHIDPSGTKKEGELKVGSNIAADVTGGGHANWIKEAEEHEDK